ncbi:MAG: hypothetical protein IKE91_04325 [Clostridia bacterium]|nr:hypothetical protein [Clostridia bacterium]
MKEKLSRMRARVNEARRLITEAEECRDATLADKAFEIVNLVKLQCDSADFTKMDDATFDKIQDMSVECTSLLMRIEKFRSS